jgi:uncharacterized oxidoreductase
MSATYHIIEQRKLRAAMRVVIEGFGSLDAEAAAVADNLVDANLTGHDSHGIGILPRYAEAYAEGSLVPNRHVKTLLEAGSMVRLDGQGGFGQVLGAEAMAIGIARARRLGCAVVALGNSHHLGRIGAWAELAVAEGMISLHFVNVVSRAIVAPFGGGDARFGTNPFTAGIPLPGREPFILDFATSVIAQGKARVAFNKDEPVPADHLLDDKGRPTTEARYSVMPPFGSILTFGQHKGYGMAVLCELLGGALAAGLTMHDGDSSKKRIANGMLTIVIDPRVLADAAAWEREALAFVDWVKASPPREGFPPVQLAGEPERRARAERGAKGVPVDTTTWQQILAAATSLKVDPAAVAQAAGIG